MHVGILVPILFQNIHHDQYYTQQNNLQHYVKLFIGNG